MWKKKAYGKTQTAQEFVNVEDITQSLLFTKDGYVFGYLYVRSGSHNLLSEFEEMAFARNLTQAMAEEKESWQLISLPRTVDTASMIGHLMTLRSKTNDDSKLRLINGEISAVQEMTQEGRKEPIIFLKCWVKATKNADVTLKKRLEIIRARLTKYKVSATIMENKDITYICKIFADLTVFQDIKEESFDDDLPILKAEKRLLSRKSDKQEKNSLLNLITPVGGLQFDVSKVIIGDVIGRVYGAVRYPSSFEFGWAVDLMNSSDSIVTIIFNPANSNELADALSKSVKRNVTEAADARDIRTKIRLEGQAEDATNLIHDIERQKEVVGHMSILAMPFTSDSNRFEDVCRDTVSRFNSKNIKLRTLGNVQKEAYQTLSPYYAAQPKINNIVEHIMPLLTVMGGSPMTINIYRDDKGYYFGRTMDGGIISLDLFFRGRDRTNSNIVVTGMPGKGKSTFVKHIIQTLYMAGVKIVIIDPEGEYKSLCKALGGTWLDAGGGIAKINPLEIRPSPPDDDEDLDDPLYRNNDNALVMHMQTLDVFFSLYLPSLTDIQKVMLKKSLLELYESFGITWNTDVSNLKSEDFPIFSDLYKLMLDKVENEPEYKNLAALLYDVAEGVDSFLWNHTTNIDMDNDFICFDTSRLNSASDNIKCAQYFNIETISWQIMSRIRDELVALISDESYLMIDPNVPQTLMFMRNISKRCRKYSGLLAVVSHAVVDFLDERVKMYGQALLDNPTYKILFGTDGKNLKETAALYDLNESEQNILLSGVRGQALCMIGSQKLHVDFQLPQYKLDLMGKAGGQ